MAAMEACPDCGLRLMGSARACPRCGTPVNEPAPDPWTSTRGRLAFGLAGVSLALSGGGCAMLAAHTPPSYSAADNSVLGLGCILAGTILLLAAIWRPDPRHRPGFWATAGGLLAMLVGTLSTLVGGLLSLVTVIAAVPSILLNGGLRAIPVWLALTVTSLLLLKAGLLLRAQATAVACAAAPRAPYDACTAVPSSASERW